MSIQKLNKEIDNLTHKIAITKDQKEKRELEERVIKLVHLKLLLQEMNHQKEVNQSNENHS